MPLLVAAEVQKNFIKAVSVPMSGPCCMGSSPGALTSPENFHAAYPACCWQPLRPCAQVAQGLIYVWPEAGPQAALQAACTRPHLLPWVDEQVRRMQQERTRPSSGLLCAAEA